MGKIHYQEIDSIDDINLKQILIKTINTKRYIDKEGNRYATRFNLRRRRIEIVRIAIGDDEVIRNRNKSIRIRQTTSSQDNTKREKSSKSTNEIFAIPNWAKDIKPKLNMSEEMFFQQIEKECEKFSERARGLIHFIKSSEAFDRKENHEGDFILDISAFYDRNVQNPLSEAQNIVVEFQRFPKPPASYVQLLTREQKQYFETLSENDQKIFLKGLIVGSTYLDSLKGLREMVDKIIQQSEKINVQKLKHDKKRIFEDLQMTCEHVLEGVQAEVTQLLGWMQANKVTFD